MSMATLILTLANKPRLLLEALASVQAQTRRDFRHVVHLDHGRWPAGVYPPSAFFNEHAESAAPQDYVAWLSDDDVWQPTYLETLAGYLDAHPEVDACYGGTRVVRYNPATGDGGLLREIPAEHVFDAERSPVGQIDGGQVLLRRSLLERLPRPWGPETLVECNRADGHFLERVAALTPIVPVVGSWVMANRVTPLSSHWQLIGGEPRFRTPQTVARINGTGAL